MERAEHVAEAKFRSDRLAVGGGTQRRALAVLRQPRFLKVNVVAHRPVPFGIDQPRELSFTLGHGLKVAVAQQVGLLEPEPRRVAFEGGYLELVALARFEGHVLFDRLATRIPAVDFLAVELHRAVRTLSESAMQLIDALPRHLEQARRDRLVGTCPIRQVDIQRRDFVVADAINLKGAVGDRGIGAEVNPRVDVFRPAEISHSDHVRLAGQDVNLDRFGGVGRFAVGIGQACGDVFGCGAQHESHQRQGRDGKDGSGSVVHFVSVYV